MLRFRAFLLLLLAVVVKNIASASAYYYGYAALVSSLPSRDDCRHRFPSSSTVMVEPNSRTGSSCRHSRMVVSRPPPRVGGGGRVHVLCSGSTGSGFDDPGMSSSTATTDSTPLIIVVNGATGTMDGAIGSNDHPMANEDNAVVVGSATTIGPRMARARRYASYFCNLFPVWTVLTAIGALRNPSLFATIPKSTFPTQIGLLMLCMGITLRPADFRRVLQRPVAVVLAFVGCYGLMPALAYSIGHVLNLPSTLKAGLILVACINGAQASNLCTYIGNGDLALSILMTTMTTIGAIIMTPLMGQLWLGRTIAVNAMAIASSTIQVVLVPILLGMGINYKFPQSVQTVVPFSPTLGVLVTCLLIGTSVAGCAESIRSAGWSLQIAAFLLHSTGGLIGYICTKPFYTEQIARTFAIQLSMKSSAFGYLLAMLHFGSDYAVPSAVSGVYMTVIGSTLAVLSRRFPPKVTMTNDQKVVPTTTAATM